MVRALMSEQCLSCGSWLFDATGNAAESYFGYHCAYCSTCKLHRHTMVADGKVTYYC